MGSDQSQSRDRIRPVIQTVIENAYLRAALHGTHKQVKDLSAGERSTLLSLGEYPVDLDVDFLLQAFAHYATAPVAPPEELAPVEFDSGEKDER